MNLIYICTNYLVNIRWLLYVLCRINACLHESYITSWQAFNFFDLHGIECCQCSSLVYIDHEQFTCGSICVGVLGKVCNNAFYKFINRSNKFSPWRCDEFSVNCSHQCFSAKSELQDHNLLILESCSIYHLLSLRMWHSHLLQYVVHLLSAT